MIYELTNRLAFHLIESGYRRLQISVSALTLLTHKSRTKHMSEHPIAIPIGPAWVGFISFAVGFCIESPTISDMTERCIIKSWTTINFD